MVASSLEALANIVDDEDVDDDEIDDVVVVVLHNYVDVGEVVDNHHHLQDQHSDDVNYQDVEASFVHHYMVHSHHNAFVIVVAVDD